MNMISKKMDCSDKWSYLFVKSQIKKHLFLPSTYLASNTSHYKKKLPKNQVKI